MNYKIVDGYLLLRENGQPVLKKSDLYIKENKIYSIGKNDNIDDSMFETVDASDKLIMPGLINSHTHVYMTIMRNYADDVDFGEWLFKRIMPVEDRLSEKAAYWSSMLGCLEMIKTGTTCFVDMHMFPSQSAKAAKEFGMRAFIGRGLVGDDLYTDGFKRFSDALAEQKEYESDTLKFVLSPHAIYSCSEKLLRQVAEEAKTRNMIKHIHLSESNTEIENCFAEHQKSPVKYLRDIGFLDQNTILAHCVKVPDEDIEIIKTSGASVITNPASNAKLGNGFAPVPKMSAQGINVVLGTDSTASNNTLNMFREMGLFSLIHKGIYCDSTAASAPYVLDLATKNAAKALGMDSKIGEICPDACADLIFIDLNATSLFPNNNIISSLCYSANGSEVDSVMVNGKFVMKKRELLTVDEEKIKFEVRKIVEKEL